MQVHKEMGYTSSEIHRDPELEGEKMDYYTPNEVMNLLGKTKTVFYDMVKSGEIPWELAPGHQRGKRFPKAAIDALVKLYQQTDSDGGRTFESSTNRDLWVGSQSVKAFYDPDDLVPFDKLVMWRSMNPDIYRTAKEGGQRIGGVTLLPLEESVIHSILKGALREQDIPIRAIKKWTDTNLSVYIPNIAVAKTDDKKIDKARGRYLLRQTLTWVNQISRTSDIARWYAYGATREGVKLLEDLGFSPFPSEDHAAYVMEGISSNPIVRSFLKRIDENEYEPIIPA